MKAAYLLEGVGVLKALLARLAEVLSPVILLIHMLADPSKGSVSVRMVSFFVSMVEFDFSEYLVLHPSHLYGK